MNIFIYSGDMFPDWNRYVKDKLSELPICINCDWHGNITKDKVKLITDTLGDELAPWPSDFLEVIGGRSVLKSLYFDLINYPDRCFNTGRSRGFMRSVFGLACGSPLDKLTGEFHICPYFRRKDVL